MERNVKLSLGVLAMVFAAIVVVTGLNGPDIAHAAQKDFVLVVGMKNSILTLDPAMHRDRETETVIRNMFDGLVTRTTDMEIVPEIAESYQQTTPTEWIFKLREGITFHNGEKLDADDVVFTFDRLTREGAVDGKTSPRKGLLGTLERVERIDDYTVRFILSKPWPVFLKMLPHQQIVPKDYITAKGNAYFAENPIGAGPFKFVKGDLSGEIIMERFENYYGGSSALPPVGPAPAKTVVFKIMPETSSRIAALQRGEAHIIQNVPAHMIRHLEFDKNVTVKRTIGTRVHWIAMNNSKPPFNDRRVRLAMNYAVDMDMIVKTILGGNGQTLAGPLLPEAFGYNADLEPYGYDPEKAKQLLSEAGYKDGFSLVIDSKAAKKEIAEAVASQLRQVGIKASVRVWDWGVLRPLVLKGERKMATSDWGNSTLDPYGILNPQLKIKGRGNYACCSLQEVHDLLEVAEVTIDQQKRAGMYRRVQQIVHDEAVWIFGYGTDVIEACAANVENWNPSPDSRINLHDVSLR